jgi:hypothetical protein
VYNQCLLYLLTFVQPKDRFVLSYCFSQLNSTDTFMGEKIWPAWAKTSGPFCGVGIYIVRANKNFHMLELKHSFHVNVLS